MARYEITFNQNADSMVVEDNTGHPGVPRNLIWDFADKVAEHQGKSYPDDTYQVQSITHVDAREDVHRPARK